MHYHYQKESSLLWMSQYILSINGVILRFEEFAMRSKQYNGEWKVSLWFLPKHVERKLINSSCCRFIEGSPRSKYFLVEVLRICQSLNEYQLVIVWSPLILEPKELNNKIVRIIIWVLFFLSNVVSAIFFCRHMYAGTLTFLLTFSLKTGYFLQSLCSSILTNSTNESQAKLFNCDVCGDWRVYIMILTYCACMRDDKVMTNTK